MCIYFIYKEITTGVKEKAEEPFLCVKLSSLCRANVKSIPPQVKKPLIKKKIDDSSKSKKRKVVKKIAQVFKTAEKKESKKIINKKEIVAEVESVKAPVNTKKELVTTRETIKRVKSVKKEIAPQKEYIDENIEKIIRLLQENLYYPRHARRRGIEGSVLVRFTLSKEAKISNIEVLSSTNPILSRGAIQTIKNIDSMFPKPKQTITFKIPISYKLY